MITGLITEILSHKSPQLWTIAPDATVFEAIQLMAEKDGINGGVHGVPMNWISIGRLRDDGDEARGVFEDIVDDVIQRIFNGTVHGVPGQGRAFDTGWILPDAGEYGQFI